MNTSKPSPGDLPPSRKWLTEREVGELRRGAKKSRNPIRDDLAILMLFRHGLRESELCNLLVDDVHLETAQLYVRRLKGSRDRMHPIEGDELRAIRRYLVVRKGKNTAHAPWLFLSEQGTQFHRNSVAYLVGQAAKRAGMPHANPHKLRHACGYYLANKGIDVRTIQDYLGHANIKNTVIYTELASNKFKGLFSN